MQVRDLAAAMERIAPTRHAESWDNVGLLVGDPSASIDRVLLTIDLTPSVLAEVRDGKFDAVVAYHPPIFAATKRAIAGNILFDAARSGFAIYSPHTALDVAEGGTNDVLADAAGLLSRKPLRLESATDRDLKLVTFVPESDVERVASALFEAGAGKIGDYTACSFRSIGTGTFLGGDSTHPVVGKPGELERAPEIRLETVVPIAKVDMVVRALRATHPYEEVAFDLVRLASPPSTAGMGRVGPIEPVAFDVLLTRIKTELSVTHALVAGPTDREVRKVAVGAGSCGDYIDDAIAQGADVFVTGEVTHHKALHAARKGLTLICLLHSNSERATLRALRSRLESELGGITFVVSETDRDPFQIR